MRTLSSHASTCLAALALPILCGCAFPGYELVPDKTPADQWPAAEHMILTNIRQLTSQDMGLTRSGEAYFSPDQSKIIFQAWPAGQQQYQMFTLDLNPDGTARAHSLKQVSPGGGACTCGFFRPDGRKIIYASSYLHPDMPNPHEYHRQGSSYSWSMPGGMDILEAEPDGSSPRQLTTAAGYDAECAYSPSGESIVFTSDRNGNPDLYIMRADGSELRQLTNQPGYDGGPFFSPDGQRIIFRADRGRNDYLQLFVINTDGTGERQLTHHGPIVNWAPWWHPNGRSVIFTTSIHGHSNYEVYILNIETGRHRRVTHHTGFDGLAVISPDGRRMMWTGQRDATASSQIYLAGFTLPDGF